MTKLSIVKNDSTYGDMLEKHLAELTKEQFNEKVTGALVVGVGTGNSGPFYSVVKGMAVLECIGLLEQLKYFLIEDSYEDY